MNIMETRMILNTVVATSNKNRNKKIAESQLLFNCLMAFITATICLTASLPNISERLINSSCLILSGLMNRLSNCPRMVITGGNANKVKNAVAPPSLRGSFFIKSVNVFLMMMP